MIPNKWTENVVVVGVGIPQEVRVECGSGGRVSEIKECQMGCYS